MDSCTLPTGLQSLSFGRGFNQSLDNDSLPAGLQSFTFDARQTRACIWDISLQACRASLIVQTRQQPGRPPLRLMPLMRLTSLLLRLRRHHLRLVLKVMLERMRRLEA